MTPENINAQDVYHFMNERNIVMSFVGDLSHEVIASLLANIRKSINSLETDAAVKEQLYSVVVECLDNITNYNFTGQEGQFAGKIPPPLFIFSVGENQYKVITGNHVSNSSIPQLKEKLEKINSLEKNGLHDFHKKTTSEKEVKGEIGIIDIAIKSGNKLSYEFRPVTDNVSFYILQTVVNK